MKFESAAVHAGEKVPAQPRNQNRQRAETAAKNAIRKTPDGGDILQQPAIAVPEASNASSNRFEAGPADCGLELGFSFFIVPATRYLAIVGTMVRERKYEANIAKTTASASGTKRYRATPDSRNMGANTMQIDSVETKAGVAICDCTVQDDFVHVLVWFCSPVAIDVLDLHRGIVHQNSNRQRQSPQRHDVDRFSHRAKENDRGQDRQRD
jgi:hypothetical protein